MRVRPPFWPALAALGGAAWFAVDGSWHDAGTWLLVAGLLAGQGEARVRDYQHGYLRGLWDHERGVINTDPKPWDRSQ